MIQFILNNELISTEASPGMAMLDFIRNEQALKGSKLVCKEGECGACTALVGMLEGKSLSYQSMTSCIMPLVNANGKHIVTIEGLNMEKLTPVQEALTKAYGTQCGFCTPGFVVSLSGYLLSNKTYTKQGIIESMDGNICRCTGYKSIERAAESILKKVKREAPKGGINALVKEDFLPGYFKTIAKRLAAIKIPKPKITGGIKVGGGTDLYVQRPQEMYESDPSAVYDQPKLNNIRIEKGICYFGSSLTMGDLYRSKVFKKALPDSDYIFHLLSSTPIRNMATIGGNLINASPIGDFTILLLGLNADIVLNQGIRKRKLPLRHFYKSYKKMDLKKGEYLEEIQFAVAKKSRPFHFEKVSQRKFLDIATVNFASTIEMDKQKRIKKIHLAVGGVGPIPMYLNKTVSFLENRLLEQSTIEAAIDIMNTEISPISDARGSADYKRLLARQLFIAQFLTIDAQCFDVKELINQP